MHRRQFLSLTGLALAGGCASRVAPSIDRDHAAAPRATTAAAFAAARRVARLAMGEIAYVERGAGAAAVFLHGAPLNGFQWRGAIDRLAGERRCVAPDFMGLGYTEVPETQSLTAHAQTEMLAALLDALAIGRVDVIASDSGGAVAQLFVARDPSRVRSLLLTNCDVEPGSPPPKVQPAIAMARAGTLAEATAWLTNKPLARATFGKAVYRDPAGFADETIDYYVQPLVRSAKRRAQYEAFHVALEPNPLAGVEAALRRATMPTRILWGADDDIFAQRDADYLDRVFPRSRGIRRVAGGKLFFPEEMPDVLAEEARQLWRVAPA
jgi:pimeloyl-ACP methyl ester carboxylesterase